MFSSIQSMFRGDKSRNSLNLKSLNGKTDNAASSKSAREGSAGWEQQGNKFEDIDMKLREKQNQKHFWTGKVTAEHPSPPQASKQTEIEE
jgi:hypothetical protein